MKSAIFLVVPIVNIASKFVDNSFAVNTSIVLKNWSNLLYILSPSRVSSKPLFVVFTNLRSNTSSNLEILRLKLD